MQIFISEMKGLTNVPPARDQRHETAIPSPNTKQLPPRLILGTCSFPSPSDKPAGNGPASIVLIKLIAALPTPSSAALGNL